jgi:hypothetical protein
MPGHKRDHRKKENFMCTLEIEGTYLYIIKDIYNKPIPNIAKQRKTDSFSSEVLNKITAHSLHSYSIIVLEFLARAIRQQKEINGIQIGNEVSNYHYLQMI